MVEISEQLRRSRARDPDEPIVSPVDRKLEHTSIGADQEVARLGIKQFVRKNPAFDFERRIDIGARNPETRKAPPRRPRAFERLEPRAAGDFGSLLFESLTELPEERALAGSSLEKIDRTFEMAGIRRETASHRPGKCGIDRRRGDKIAPFPHPPDPAVVAPLRIIERRLHEFGKGHRPLPFDPLPQEVRKTHKHSIAGRQRGRRPAARSKYTGDMRRENETRDNAADFKIAVAGDSPTELFRNAALATLDLLLGPRRPRGRDAFGIVVTGESEESLLVSFLNEIVLAVTAEGRPLASIDEIRVEGHRVRARFRAGKKLPILEAVKSATGHNLEIRKFGGRLEAEVIFDA
jgi:SHS2 domain-containing protein